MTTRTWTVDDVLSYKPCAAYDRARITELFAGRAALTLREILALDIPAADRRPLSLIQPKGGAL